ncbi:uncharacterized protein [Diadema antillarum]|uniref:uncharacterized protein isoform X1 n=2 Tax=Diadema antillarum TaxID=105358 RepID=UPI003A876332
MALSRKGRPPSYDQAMERLGRMNDQEPSIPLQGVYRQRTDNDLQKELTGKRLNGSDQPATISHTAIQPTYLLQPQTVHLPISPSPTPKSPVFPPDPPGHYTKEKRYKKSTSRSVSKREAALAMAAATTSSSYDNQLSGEGSSTSPTTAANDPVVMKPMVTRVGADGRTYLRDMSIVVVENEEHETPNTKIVYGTPALPNEYQWYAILGMFCCFVFGVMSFTRSKQVREKFERGEYREAQEASASARNWGNAALIGGALIIIVFIFLLFVNPCPLARAIAADHICPRGT